MRILVAAPGDYYSRVNFIDMFRQMGHEVTHWDFTNDTVLHLEQLVAKTKPDLLFHILVNDELSGDDIAELRCLAPGLKVLQWSSDDNWRLPVSLQNAANYDFCTTNDPDAVPLYRAKGIEQIRHVQYGVNVAALRPRTPHWAGDTDLYAPEYLEQPFDVSFVGQAYIGRAEFVAGLAARGVKVNVWGQGFSEKPLPHDRMIETLRGSKIVLGMNWVAGGREAGFGPQIKGRHFENAALGCFQLVNADRHLSRYFADDEIAIYTSLEDCAAKIGYYLCRADKRKAIAKAGQARVLRDHTWQKRWSEALPELFA